MSEIDVNKVKRLIGEMFRDDRLNVIKEGKYDDLKDNEKSAFNFNEDTFNEFVNVMNTPFIDKV